MSSLESPRSWIALALVTAAFFLSGPVEDGVFRLLAQAMGLQRAPAGTLALIPYGTLMVVRLLWDCGLWVAVCRVLGNGWLGFPVGETRPVERSSGGLVVGLAVMLFVMLAIRAMGAAVVTMPAQSASAAVAHGFGWLVFDYLGAAGEELSGRAIILVVVARFVGLRGAILVSGLMFAAIHLGNPGASGLWLFRLFLQGMLLAYAVVRTGSLWWSIGYHTGWNWISAPLFGAAGSGYLDEGHLLEFAPRGSDLITGGAVGPEGSVFAVVAVILAFGLLIISTKARPASSGAAPSQSP